MTPGPKELTADEMQHMLDVDVKDKKMLWETGIVTPTPHYPQGKITVFIPSCRTNHSVGRRVRVATIGVFCDHPAMCRVCEFADHNHNLRFCPKCKIPRDMLRGIAGLMPSRLPILSTIDSFTFGSVSETNSRRASR